MLAVIFSRHAVGIALGVIPFAAFLLPAPLGLALGMTWTGVWIFLTLPGMMIIAGLVGDVIRVFRGDRKSVV